MTDSDAIIVVEGRADVLTLLKYGVKNAIAVEGTNVPDGVAELTHHRTVTAFLDGDRGGDLILEELSQVGDVDYVAFAPAGESVEDLDHHQLFTALRNKVPYDTVSGMNEPREAVAATDGSSTPAPAPTESTTDRDDDSSQAVDGPATSPPETASPSAPTGDTDGRGETVDDGADRNDVSDGSATDPTAESASAETSSDAVAGDDTSDADAEPETVYGHATAIVRRNTGCVRLLDADGDAIGEADASEAYDTLEGLETVPTTIVLDEILDQRLLDLAADRGVERIVARSLGQFTKRPTGVRIHAIDEIADEPPNAE